MLRNLNDLEDYTIHAVDGNIGHLKDLYFDDKSWVIRYLVVDTGNWLLSRKVLISPISIGAPNWQQRELPVAITKEQVKDSPDFDTEKPVSRQYEIGYFGYYGYPLYWGGTGLWGEEAFPNMLIPGYIDMAAPSVPQPNGQESTDVASEALLRQREHEHDDPHLRSCTELVNYHIEATDGDIGHLKGILIDDETWAIRYLIVDTGNWWLGHQVLIAPQWIKEVRWPDTTISINLRRQTLQDAPPYDPTVELSRAQEKDLHEHYSIAGYWETEVQREAETT